MRFSKACLGFLGVILLPITIASAEQSWTGNLIVKYRHAPLALGGNSRSLNRSGNLQRVSVRPQALTMSGSGAVIEPLSTYNNECAAFDGPNVEFCEPDFWIESDLTPSDPSYSEMVSLAQIRAPQAWDLQTGSADIVVAIMDTGMDLSHPDLIANKWSNPGEIPDGIDNDGNGFVDDLNGYDFFNNDSSPMDDNGHGTHVSGTIGAAGNNGVGVTGVAWKVSLLPLKFLGAGGGGPLSNALLAMDYLIDLKERYHLKVIVNASWGGEFYSQSLEEGIQELGAAGILFVAAAGNSGKDTDLALHSPSGLNSANILSVAAVDTKGKLATFSNYGYSSVDIAAPGTSILSTLPNGGYGTLSGTSMATPHVAGVAALLWAAHPEMTDLQLKDQLLNTAAPSLLPIATGGIVDAYAALTGDISAPPPPSAGDLKITEIRDRATKIVDALTPGGTFSVRLKSDNNAENALISASIYGTPCPTQLGAVQFANKVRVRGRLPKKLVRGSVEFTVTSANGGSDSRTAKIRSKDSLRTHHKKGVKAQKAKILEEELNSVCDKLAASLH